MPTVIDKLIVELGLDPSDFDKGQKAAAASMVRTTAQVKKANTEMGDSFVAFTKKFLSAAAAIALLKKLVGALADVSTETRRLGIDSENFNLSASRMRNWQNAVEMVGGKAEDVTRSIEGLNKAVFDLTVMGQSSGSLEMLTRLGVKFQDATGHARDFNDVALDTADALERAQQAGTYNRNEAFNAAKAAGFDDGTAQLLLLGRTGAEKELAKQRERHQVNGEDIAAATKIERTRTNVEQAATSGAIQANTVGVNAIADIGNAYNATVARTTNALEGLANAADRAAERVSGAGLNASASRAGSVGRREQIFRGAIRDSAKKHGVPYGVLDGLIHAESGYDPSRVYGGPQPAYRYRQGRRILGPVTRHRTTARQGRGRPVGASIAVLQRRRRPRVCSASARPAATAGNH